MRGIKTILIDPLDSVMAAFGSLFFSVIFYLASLFIGCFAGVFLGIFLHKLELDSVFISTHPFLYAAFMYFASLVFWWAAYASDNPIFLRFCIIMILFLCGFGPFLITVESLQPSIWELMIEESVRNAQ